MMKGKLSLVLVLAIAYFCCGSTAVGESLSNQASPPERTYGVRLVDEGAPDSPLKASGQIVFHEQLYQNAVGFRWQVDTAYTNASLKDIRAYEVEIDATPERGGGFVYIDHKDFFFKRQSIFPPGSQQVWRDNDSARAMVGYDASKQRPTIVKATFTVRFVEFSDGSTYGGGKWGESLREARLATLAGMKELKQAYWEGGDTALRRALDAALARQDNLTPSKEQLEHLRVTLDQDGSAALIVVLEDFLRVAKERGVSVN